MDPLLRRRTALTPGESDPTALQVMSPNERVGAPLPDATADVDGHHDLVPAMSAGMVNGTPPPGGVGSAQEPEDNQRLVASGQRHEDLLQSVRSNLAPPGTGGLQMTSPQSQFNTALSQSYGATEAGQPPVQMQMEVSTSTTVVQQAQAGLRQGFRWLGEIVHRTMGVDPGEYQIDPLLIPSPLPSRASPPGQAGSTGSVVGPTTPNRRSLRPPVTWEQAVEQPPLFTNDQVRQFQRMQQSAPQLYGPQQSRDEQASSSNTTDIQEEVRRQVAEFMAQQAEAMQRLRDENLAWRERFNQSAASQVFPKPPGPCAVEPPVSVPAPGSGVGIPSLVQPVGVVSEAPTGAASAGVNMLSLASALPGISVPALSKAPPVGRQGTVRTAGVESSGNVARASSTPPAGRLGSQQSVGAHAPAGGPGPQEMPHMSVGATNAAQGVPAQGPSSTGPVSPPPLSQPQNPWLRGSVESDLLSGLVTGMRQLQDVLIKKESGAEASGNEPETVKPGVSSLPKLKPIDPNSSPIDFQDWITLLKAPMHDLSATSHLWWPQVGHEAEQAYERFATASPLERLTVKPNIPPELISGKWSRVNSRATSMLLAAIGDDLRAEMVNRRVCDSAVGIVYRLMTLYAPGGESEKSLTLKKLQTPTRCNEPQAAAEELRSWERWKSRAEVLGLLTPDPTVLVKALASITSGILEKAQHSEISFRTSLVRSLLQVDSRPTMDTVMQFHAHLLGEMEQLTSASPTRKGNGSVGNSQSEANNNGNNAQQGPRVKALQPNAQASPSAMSPDEKAATPCRHFGTDKGCSRGSKCPFKHDWSKVQDQRERCRECSAKGHFAKDCPTKNSKGDGKGKGKPKGKYGGKSTEGGNQNNASSSAKTAKVEAEASDPQPASASEQAPEQAPAVQIQALLSDMSNVVKSLTPSSLKAFQVDEPSEPLSALRKVEPEVIENEPVEGETGLVDSGASHPLRTASEQELSTATQVPVTLAGDEKSMLYQSQLGTVLVPDPAQSLVPMGALVECLGCSVHWTPKALKIWHPQHGRLKVGLRNRCPEVAAEMALTLIRELEEQRLQQFSQQVTQMEARLEALRFQEEKGWVEHFMDYRKSGSATSMWKAIISCPFTKDLPTDVQGMLVEEWDPKDPNVGWAYLKSLPLPRRLRKALLRSRSWTVHLYAGESDARDPLRAVCKGDKVLLEVDVCRSKAWDMHAKASVYRVLLWAACEGRIDEVLGGPSCRTWSILRSIPKEGFPAPGRAANSLYGLDDLSPKERLKVDQDTALVAKQLLVWLSRVLLIGGCRVPCEEELSGLVGFLMEHPQDPQRYRPSSPEVQQCPSLWRTSMWTAFRDAFGFEELHFDQGALGHRTVKPTTVGTNLLGLADLHGLKADPEKVQSSREVPSHLMAQWAPQLKQRIADAIASAHVPSAPSVEHLDEVIRTSKLSAAERLAWLAHLQNDHVPYRADCSTCVLAAGTGHHHRRVKHPTPFTLSLDIAGPFKTKGRDFFDNRYRYLLVGAYRLPAQFLRNPADADAEVPAEEPAPPPNDPLELGEEESSEARPADAEVDEPLEPHTADAEVDEPEFEEEGEEDAEEGAGVGPVDDLEEKVEELKKKIELRTIYLVQPPKTRKGPEVLQAIQQFKVQLRRKGLPLHTLHSDRAREFNTRALKGWLADHGLYHSRSSGSEPAGNSTAELGVRWVKSKVRALLVNHEAREWPLAAQHAVQQQWDQRLPPSGHHPDGKVSPAFGQVVWYKAKSYAGAAEKKEEAKVSDKDLAPRWKKGYYRGKSPDVQGGHILAREDGGLVIAKGIKDKVIVPHEEEELALPELEAEAVHPEPSRRVVDKSSPPLPPPGRDEPPVEVIAPGEEGLEERAADATAPEPRRRIVGKSTPLAPPGGDGPPLEAAIQVEGQIPRGSMISGLVDVIQNTPILCEAPVARANAEAKREASYQTMGVFQHGGVVGITKVTHSHDEVVRRACELIKRDHPGHSFTSITCSKNTRMPLHRDSHNDPATKNLISPLCVPRDGSGGIWVELRLGDPLLSEVVEMRSVKGKQIPGNCLNLKGPIQIRPDRWHSSDDWSEDEGDRILLVAHTVQGWRRLSAEQRECLHDLGFNLPNTAPREGEAAAETPKLRALSTLRNSGGAEGNSSSHDSSESSSSSTSSSPVSHGSEAGHPYHSVGDLVNRIAEEFGLEITSSDEEFERVHNFFGDIPGFADDAAYRPDLVEERVREWAIRRPLPHPDLPGGVNLQGLTMAEVHGAQMMIAYYLEKLSRNRSRDSTPSPPPTGSPALRVLQVPVSNAIRKDSAPQSAVLKLDDEAPRLRMMSVGLPSCVEQRAAFEVLDEGDIARMMIAEIEQQLKKAAVPQLASRPFLRKAEVQCTPNVEALLAELEKEGKPLEVVHTVELREVKENLAKWVPSGRKELDNLVTNKKALRRMKRHELPKGTRLVPGKGVFTVKPEGDGYKRKTRFVACGNYLPNDGVGDLYAAGADATTLRAILSYSAGRPWVAGTTDIRQAFVLAPWKGEPVAVTPPKVAIDMGLCEPDEVWFVDQALYGLRESPKLWGDFRDAELRRARWLVDGVEYRLEQMTSDDQLWRIVASTLRKDGSKDLETTFGFILVYVDDIFTVGESSVIGGFHNWLSSKWECDPVAMLAANKPIRFLGMEIHLGEEGKSFEVSQKGFIKELLRSHEHKGTKSWSMGPRDLLLLTPEEEEELLQDNPAPLTDEPVLRQAQRRVGELLWLMSRTRPDLQYVVALMASRATRSPEVVNRIGQRLLDYLNQTSGYRLVFDGKAEAQDELCVFTDSSFAPAGARSHGAAVVTFRGSPICWRSSRQALVTLSTAESELVEAVEGALLLKSTEGLIREISGCSPNPVLKVDNMSAMQLLNGSAGSWRTRHLRLRSSWLKEQIAQGLLTVVHEPGETQLADLGTKPLPKQRLKDLVGLWKLRDFPDRKVAALTVTHPHTAQTSSLTCLQGMIAKLALLTQCACGVAERVQEEESKEPLPVQSSVELYVLIIMLAICVIALWEAGRTCVRTGSEAVRLRALSASPKSRVDPKHKPLNKAECRELSTLCHRDPACPLPPAEAERFAELLARLNEGQAPVSREQGAASLSCEPAASPLPRAPELREEREEHVPAGTVEASTQTDPEPAFRRLTPEVMPTPIVRIVPTPYEGPFFCTFDRRTKIHTDPNCWGLRNVPHAAVQHREMCANCLARLHAAHGQ